MRREWVSIGRRRQSEQIPLRISTPHRENIRGSSFAEGKFLSAIVLGYIKAKS